MNLFVLTATIVGCLFDEESFKAAKPLFGSIEQAFTLRLFWG